MRVEVASCRLDHNLLDSWLALASWYFPGPRRLQLQPTTFNEVPTLPSLTSLVVLDRNIKYHSNSIYGLGRFPTISLFSPLPVLTN